MLGDERLKYENGTEQTSCCRNAPWLLTIQKREWELEKSENSGDKVSVRTLQVSDEQR